MCFVHERDVLIGKIDTAYICSALSTPRHHLSHYEMVYPKVGRVRFDIHGRPGLLVAQPPRRRPVATTHIRGNDIRVRRAGSYAGSIGGWIEIGPGMGGEQWAIGDDLISTLSRASQRFGLERRVLMTQYYRRRDTTKIQNRLERPL